MIDMKKCSMAYSLALTMALIGVSFLGIGFIFTKLPEPFSFFYVNLVGAGVGALTIGLSWLVPTFLGSFFSFDSVKLRLRIWGVLILEAMVTVIYLVTIIICGIDVLKHPWTTNVLFALIILMTLLISSTFFMAAAQPTEEEPEKSSKVLFIRRKQ